jgi:hypothetical protein
VSLTDSWLSLTRWRESNVTRMVVPLIPPTVGSDIAAVCERRHRRREEEAAAAI